MSSTTNITEWPAESDTAKITTERASRRFHQMAAIERQLSLTSVDITACKDHLKELTETKDGLLLRLRASARDEGELPLFDLDGE